MKDYYLILELDVSATQQEIKKAYRKLALQYHPDKNPNDAYAAARFSEIKEAYEVLTNPAKKEYYLEQRWFEKSMGKKKASGPVTPENILIQSLEFDRHVSKLDVHRMNREGLYQYVATELLPEDSIEKLNGLGDLSLNEEIIALLLKNLFVIPADRLSDLEIRMMKINSGEKTRSTFQSAIQTYKRHHHYEKNKIWIIFLVVIIISLAIYFAAQ